MAKRKNSTALFEVMAAHRARQVQAGITPTFTPPAVSHAPPPGQLTKSFAKPGFLAIAKKWAGDALKAHMQRRAAVLEQAQAAAAALDGSDPTAGMTAQALVARRDAPVVSAPTYAEEAIAAPEAETNTTEIEAPTAPTTFAGTHSEVIRTYGRAEINEQKSIGRTPTGNHLEYDRDRHQVTLKVRFTTAAISLFALLVVIGTAYIIGTRAGSPAKHPTNASTPSPQKEGTSALDVGGRRGAAKPEKAGDPVLAGDRVGGSATAGVQPSASEGAPQGSLGVNFEDAKMTEDGSTARRTVGLNYCVIQSYPPDFRDTAVEVSKFLNANGIANTIEFGSPQNHATTNWYVLVGIRGFPAGYNHMPDEYVKSIMKVAATFSQKSKLNKPSTYFVKWAE